MGTNDCLDVHPRAMSINLNNSLLERAFAKICPDLVFLASQRSKQSALLPLIDKVKHKQTVCTAAVNRTNKSRTVKINGLQSEREKQRAEDIYDALRADMDLNRVFLVGVIISSILRFAYTSCKVNIEGIEKLRRAAQAGSVVLLPNHRSHIDYLLLSYICYGAGVKMPKICAGDNLQLPFVGWLFRGSGAFFIRRRFGNDALYRAVVQEYLRKLVSDGECIEFFIEGGRSRSGKYLHPKLGMLDYVVRTVAEGVSTRVHVVPISISYDRVFEMDSLVSELLGRRKHKESLWRIARRITMLLRGVHLGRIEVRIGDPLNVAEFIGAASLMPERRLQSSSRCHSATEALASAVQRSWGKSGVVLPISFIVLAMLTLESFQSGEHPQPVTGRHILGVASYLASIAHSLDVPVQSITIEDLGRSLYVLSNAGLCEESHSKYSEPEAIWSNIVAPSLQCYMDSNPHVTWDGVFEAVSMTATHLLHRGVRRKTIKLLDKSYCLKRSTLARTAANVYINALVPCLGSIALVEVAIRAFGVGPMKAIGVNIAKEHFCYLSKILEADFPGFLHHRSTSNFAVNTQCDMSRELLYCETVTRCKDAHLFREESETLFSPIQSPYSMFEHALALMVLPVVETHIQVYSAIIDTAEQLVYPQEICVIKTEAESPVSSSNDDAPILLPMENITVRCLAASIAHPLVVGRCLLSPITTEGIAAAFDSLVLDGIIRKGSPLVFA